jgi:NTE family protein
LCGQEAVFCLSNRAITMPEVYGVFEGGGVRGTALVGAVKAAEEFGFTFSGYAGTSAGSIVASLLAAGYDADQLKKALMEKNLLEFLDPAGFGPKLLRLWRHQGFYKGEAFYRWMRQQLSLARTDGNSPNQRVAFSDLPNLFVIAADIKNRDTMLFGSRTGDVEVASAVRGSMSIPFFFTPYPYLDRVLVDGGILSNFPAWVFAQAGMPEQPILGFRLLPEDAPPPKINNVIDLATNMVFTQMKVLNERQIESVPQLHTIWLPTKGIKTTQFEITDAQKELLYQAGYEAAKSQLGTIAIE